MMIPELWVIAFTAGMRERSGLPKEAYRDGLSEREVLTLYRARPDGVNHALDYCQKKWGLTPVNKEPQQ
jgi:hypothetical protein